MKHFSETIVIFVLFLVQFIDVLDFMVVMPLGPDLSLALGIENANLGWLASSYTLAAAFSGIASAAFVDRFERKKAFICVLSGLVMANIFSANAWNTESLLLSRFLAGLFGGPTTSICYAIVADLFPENRRGDVMGKIMSGFSLAAIFGVPIGLKTALLFGWCASFYAVAILGIIAIILIVLYMPSITDHLNGVTKNKVTYLSLFNKRLYIFSFIAVITGSVASFMIIPYVAPFIQLNMNYPRSDISFVYLIGGIGSFVAMHIAGKFVDKTSSALTTMFSNIFILFSLIFGFVVVAKFVSPAYLFAPFMVGMAIRNVSNYTLFSKIPSLNERAGFMSILSCIQHLASSVGAVATSIIVTETNNKLVFMDVSAMLASMLFLVTPFILKIIEKDARLKLK